MIETEPQSKAAAELMTLYRFVDKVLILKPNCGTASGWDVEMARISDVEMSGVKDLQ